MTRLRQRNAFTLIELLVVIAIIGIMIAMIIPAVNASRESARRAACQNNMTQIGIAAHNYQLAHGVYPPGTHGDPGPIENIAQGNHHNWTVPVLPYLGEMNVYRHVDREASVYAPVNEPARKMTIPVLVCPSDGFEHLEFPASNYAGCQNDLEAPINTDNSGMFFLDSKLTYDDISDGAAYTIFFGEKLALAGDLGWMSGTRATLRNTGWPINFNPQSPPPTGASADDKAQPSDEPDEPHGADEANDGNNAGEEEGLTQEPSDDPANEPLANAATTPEPKTVDPAANNPLYVGGFRSRHTGGANFSFGDGTVRFLSETIDQKVLQQLGNRQDGKLLDAPF